MKTVLQDLYAPISEPLAGVRELMAGLWLDALQLAPAQVKPPKPRAGKLLRPALCLNAAGALGIERLETCMKLAAAFEALHIASLAHDDVLDNAAMRRGSVSLNALWDNHAAVLGGDYLVARSVEFLGEYGSSDLIVNAIQSVRCMAEGELLFFNRPPDEVEEEHCLQLARQKTASLFAEACAAPTFITRPEHREALYNFGMAFGVAFQLIDDLLDLTQPESALGKPSCGDIVEGKTTLPVLLMRERLDAAERARLDSLRGSEITDAVRGWVRERLEATGAGAETARRAENYRNEALSRLQTLPPSPYRDAMEGIVHFILVRDF